MVSQNGDGSLALQFQLVGNQWSTPYTLSQGTANISPVLACSLPSTWFVLTAVWINSEDNSVWTNTYGSGLHTPTQLSSGSDVNSKPTVALVTLLAPYQNDNRLVTAAYTIINSKEYDSSYHDFFMAEVKQMGIANADDYVAEYFFCANAQINEVGVKIMCRSIGVINSWGENKRPISL